MKATLAAIILIFASSLAFAETRYVSDVIYVPVRSGPGIQFRIIYSRLRTGMQVERIAVAEDETWTQIRTRNGLEGWVESQYLIDEPTARQRLEQTEAQMTQARDKARTLQEELDKLRSEHEQLQQQLSTQASERDMYEEEYTNLKMLSADTIEINDRYRELLAKHEMMQTECDALQAENDRLKADKVITHWLVGAGMVLGGMFLMLIMPVLIPKKRNSDWVN